MYFISIMQKKADGSLKPPAGRTYRALRMRHVAIASAEKRILKFHFADKKLILGFIEPECDKLEFFFL
jgi:hypothetical protein